MINKNNLVTIPPMGSVEMGFPSGIERLLVPYRDTETSVPVAPNIELLSKAARSVILPAVESLIGEHGSKQIVGVACVLYRYYTDRIENWSAEKIQDLLIGISPEDVQKLTSDTIYPSIAFLTKIMKEKGDHFFDLDFFNDATFIIGPLVSDPPPSFSGFPNARAESDAASLLIDQSVAIHGETLLADFPLPGGRDRIFNSEVVTMLENVFHPDPIPGN